MAGRNPQTIKRLRGGVSRTVLRASLSSDRPHSFFYLDPPYWQTAGYGGSFEWAQYEKLAETMADAQG